MTEQLILPFDRFQIPERHLRWLIVANAGDYPEKRHWFYPFKTRFLQAHGLPDGFDLQIITKRCWCHDGIYRGMDDHWPEYRWEICHKCGGTGIYLNKNILLTRWLVNGHVFHCPSSYVYVPGRDEIKETFHGLIAHSPVRGSLARLSMERLLLRYEPKLFYTLWLGRWRSWTHQRKSGLRWQISGHIGRIKRLLTLHCVDDELPF